MRSQDLKCGPGTLGFSAAQETAHTVVFVVIVVLFFKASSVCDWQQYIIRYFPRDLRRRNILA